MPPIYHLTTADAWQAARAAGTYSESTRGKTLAEVGFIHCSYADQVAQVAAAFYSDVPGLVLLTIDADRLVAPVHAEDLEGHGQAFPHVYGPINLDAVVDVKPFPPPEL